METANTTQRVFSNRFFSDKYVYAGENAVETTIRQAWYNEHEFNQKVIPPETENFKPLLRPGCTNWFQVVGLANANCISRIVQEFGLHNVDVRDILSPNHIVKIDVLDDYITIVLNHSTFNAKNIISSEHICIIVKKGLVLTFVENENELFNHVQKSLKNNVMGLREAPSGLLLAFLLNTILGGLIETANKVEKLLVTIEDRLLENEHDQSHVIVRRIQQCRHLTLRMRKNTLPLKNDFNRLCEEKPGIINKAILPVFNDLDDQLEYVIQSIANSREILTSLVDLYASNNDFKMNAVMKRLTVVSTLFIPVTFIVGLWGMNFANMPELNWKQGYAFAWAIILAAGAGTWFFMKKKGWF